MPDAVYRHRIPIRYGEVDPQGVVFNAHYLAYCDDASDTWFRTTLGRFESLGWDPMVVKATVEWQGSAGVGDVLDVDVRASRWGTTSFDVDFTGTVGDRPVFTAVVTYVGVRPGTTDPVPPPDEVRAALVG